MDHPEKSFTALSLCPGLRGLERGVERVTGKLNVLAYVEIEAFAVTNLVASMEAGLVDPALIWTNLKTFEPEPFQGRVDFIFGGYPCQPFSYAGNRLGDQDPRHLWPYTRNTIRVVRPVVCFFENVAGHLTLGYPEVKQSLEEMGYVVTEGIFSAQEVGATHRRERLFILAVLGHSGNNYRRLPEAGHREDSIKASGASQTLVDSQHPRLEGLPRYVNRPGRSFWKETGPVAEASLFPAPQGIYQHDWEEPRTVEPGLGCTVNGYNFREDLLRAYGNSVVEQTAELAFIDLMNKHLTQL